jgi:phage terminase large subunit GpA-like protein
LQVFVNTVLGETWSQQGDAPEWQRLYDRREDYQIGVVPAGGLVLTCGVDIQRDRIEAEIVAWGRGKESWSIDYRVMEGDTSRAEVWAKLTALLGERFPTRTGVDLHILRMAVDSGYATQEVYAWARSQASEQVMVVKGVDQAAVPVGQPTAVDVTYAGKRVTRGIKVWPVSSSILKSELYGWLRLERPTEESAAPCPPGYCHFPKYQEEYFKQLTAEQLVHRVIKGYRRPEWQKTRERNESLDCRVYARAAASIVGLDRAQEGDWQQLEIQIAPKPADGQETRRVEQNREPWIPRRPIRWRFDGS